MSEKKSGESESMGGRVGKWSDKSKVTLSLGKAGYKCNLDMMVRPVCASVDKFGG